MANSRRAASIIRSDAGGDEEGRKSGSDAMVFAESQCAGSRTRAVLGGQWWSEKPRLRLTPLSMLAMTRR